MSINVWGYLKEYEEEQGEILEAIKKVLSSGSLVLGPSVEGFEKEFASYCGARYGVGVDNGTNAISLALRAVGVKPGDEVITVSNTAVPTVAAIVAAGAVPRFVDVLPDTYLMDVSSVAAAITPKTTCILPVHLYGQCVDMEGIASLAEEFGLKTVEDCAQSHGAEFQGKKAGAMSDASAFSFYPTKILGGYGDGGMVLTSDSEVEARLRRLRFYGMKDAYYALEDGYNSRLDELHAEVLRGKLTHLDRYVSRRRELAARYNECLAETGLVLPEESDGCLHAYYLYVVRHARRDAIIEALKAHDINVNVSYRWPIHTMPAYQSLGYGEGDLPETERAAQEVFSLPMYPSLSDEEQDTVCSVLTDVMRSA